MLKKLLVVLALSTCAAAYAFAQADKAIIVTTCGTAPFTYTAGQVQPVVQDVNGNICTAGSASISGSVNATAITIPNGAATTSTGLTVSSTNAFQQALAASTTRKSCTIQYLGTSTGRVHFGTLGAATTPLALVLGPNQPAYCGANGVVSTSAVNVTGTTGDYFLILSQ